MFAGDSSFGDDSMEMILSMIVSTCMVQRALDLVREIYLKDECLRSSQDLESQSDFKG